MYYLNCRVGIGDQITEKKTMNKNKLLMKARTSSTCTLKYLLHCLKQVINTQVLTVDIHFCCKFQQERSVRSG